MIRVHLPDPDDVAEVIECLLLGADACATHAPELAERRRRLAHDLGDGLDALPKPSPPEQEGSRS